MMARRIYAFQRRDSDLRGKRQGFTLVGWLVVIAIIALLPPTVVTSGDSREPSLMEQTLAAVQECTAKSPAPWPPVWRQEYVDTIRAALKQRVQSQAEARARERQLGVAVWQTEYLSFLLGALLETAQEQEP